MGTILSVIRVVAAADRGAVIDLNFDDLTNAVQVVDDV